MDSRVPAPDGTEVALEMTDIDRVKADLPGMVVGYQQYDGMVNHKAYDGNPKPDVRFGQDAADKIVFAG
jgi:hypothetical protein